MDKKRCGEKMENFLEIGRVERVAFMELALSLVASMVVLFYTLIAVNATLEELTDEKMIPINKSFQQSGIVRLGLWWTWLAVGSMALVTGLQFWTSLKLFSASALESDVYKALGKVRIWWNLTIVFLVMQVVVFAPHIFTAGCAEWDTDRLSSVLRQITFILWRVNFMIIVYKFKKELETALVPVGDAESGTVFLDKVLVK